MSLDRDWIEAHVPQRAAMCLLDEVLSWDEQQVLCRSASHRRADHPLRAHGRLGSACTIEYAAQAAAVHGALSAPASAATGSVTRFGMLTSVRAVELMVARLDGITGDLLVHAARIHADAGSALYSFSVSEQRAQGPPNFLARGRLGLWLDGGVQRARA